VDVAAAISKGAIRVTANRIVLIKRIIGLPMQAHATARAPRLLSGFFRTWHQGKS
jgi:hypothetical protein